jgi:hypothetical protein
MGQVWVFDCSEAINDCVEHGQPISSPEGGVVPKVLDLIQRGQVSSLQEGFLLCNSLLDFRSKHVFRKRLVESADRCFKFFKGLAVVLVESEVLFVHAIGLR